MNKRDDVAWRAKVVQAIASNTTMSETLRELNLKVNGGNFTTLKKCIAAWELSTKHWLGYGHLKGRQAYNKGQGPPLEEVMVENSSYNRGSLKRRLIDKGILKNRCLCGQGTKWKKQPLVLVLDHINGVKNDHRLENLRLLCPNCNSQTSTFSGRNVKRLGSVG